MNTVLFGDLFQFIRNGMNVKQDKSGDGLPISRIETISDGSVNPEKVGFAGLTGKAAAGWLLEPGDILFSHINSVDHVGKCAVYCGTPGKLVHGMNLLNLRCDQSKISHEFAKYLIRSSGFRERLANFINKAVNQASVSIGNLRTIPVTVPPLPEQRRIAAILDQADALRAKRREALAELDSLTGSIFVKMFGDPGSNPRSWPELQLGELIVGAPNNGIFKKNDEYGVGTPVVWVEELFKGNEIDLSSSRALAASPRDKARYGLRNGDLLFCRSSLKLAGIGYNNVYLGEDGEALFECHVIRISPDKAKVEPRFLNFVLRMPSQRQKLFKFAKTVTMTTIDQEGLLRVSVPVPPVELQRKFCAHLTAVDRVRRRQTDTVEELDALFASLQHRAFAGQL